MPDSKESWNQVGESFSALGRRLKEHYGQEPKERRPAPGERKAVEDALRQLADALDHAFTSVGDAVREPGFKEDLRRAANSLGDAMSTTFAEVSDDLRDRFKRPGGKR